MFRFFFFLWVTSWCLFGTWFFQLILKTQCRDRNLVFSVQYFSISYVKFSQFTKMTTNEQNHGDGNWTNALRVKKSFKSVLFNIYLARVEYRLEDFELTWLYCSFAFSFHCWRCTLENEWIANLLILILSVH